MLQFTTSAIGDSKLLKRRLDIYRSRPIDLRVSVSDSTRLGSSFDPGRGRASTSTRIPLQENGRSILRTASAAPSTTPPSTKGRARAVGVQKTTSPGAGPLDVSSGHPCSPTLTLRGPGVPEDGKAPSTDSSPTIFGRGSASIQLGWGRMNTGLSSS